MINYMYGKCPTLRGADEICEMFEIVDLAERFTVSGLEEEYKTAMFLYFRERPRWITQPKNQKLYGNILLREYLRYKGTTVSCIEYVAYN